VSRYRSDLSAAHERIEKLEEELALSGRPVSAPPSRPPRTGTRIAATFLATATIIVGLYEGRRHHDENHHHVAVEAPTAKPKKGIERPYAPPPPKFAATWSGSVPAVVDVDGDGTMDLVGVVTRRTDGVGTRHVVAIDGHTFGVKWTAGPFGGAGDVPLAVLGQKVVVADDRLRTFSLVNGDRVTDQAIDGRVLDLCTIATQTSPTILVQRRPGTPMVLGADLVLRPAPASARCPERSRPGASRTFEDRDRHVVVSEDLWAVGFKGNASAPSWEGSLLFSIDHRHEHDAHVVRDGRLVSFYEADAGLWRILAHDIATGRELWYGFVPRLESSQLTAFSIEGPYVLVVAEGTLHVIEASSGRYLHRIDASST